MKTVYLVRHAKSSWEELGMKDFDRPLNERGERNAPEMADRLRRKQLSIDYFVSSPAKRARQTALLFAEKLGYDSRKILFEPNLYMAGVHEIIAAIAAVPSSANSVAVFCHNPGITECANSFTNVRIDNMPTAAVFAVSADCQSWKEFEAAPKQFLFFDYPKSQPE